MGTNSVPTPSENQGGALASTTSFSVCLDTWLDTMDLDTKASIWIAKTTKITGAGLVYFVTMFIEELDRPQAA